MPLTSGQEDTHDALCGPKENLSLQTKCGTHSDAKKVPVGIETGSSAWQAHILTTIPPDLTD